MNVRVIGWDGGKTSIAAEGFDRAGKGYVKQAHLWPGRRGKMRVDMERRDRRIIYLHMIRDPRDIAVSMAHYWDKTIDEALDQMIEGPGPLELPPWRTYIESWFPYYVPILRYEDFHQGAENELGRVLNHLQLKPKRDLAEVVEHQSFAEKKKEMEENGYKYPFGRKAQLKHLRSGQAGEWETAFSRKQKDRTQMAWNGLLKRLGYA